MSVDELGRASQPPSSGVRRAAALLVALGQESSPELLRHLSSTELESVAAAISTLGSLSQAEAGIILRDFEEQFQAMKIPACGGPEYARSLVARAFGDEFADQLTKKLPLAERRTPDSMKIVGSANPEELAMLLEKENPQTTAILASSLKPERAARVIRALPEDQQGDVVLRMAALKETSPRTVEMIADDIAGRLRINLTSERSPAGGLQTVAEVLNQLDAVEGDRLLDRIAGESSQTAEAIRRLLFVFDDILKLDQKAMREIVGRVDRKLLVVGLKGTGDELRNHFVSVMSKNGAAMLLDDMEALGPVRIKEVEGAQQEIIGIIRQLEAEGILDLKSSGGEQYVV
jgi:flagellar motor switch protein FliG